MLSPTPDFPGLIAVVLQSLSPAYCLFSLLNLIHLSQVSTLVQAYLRDIVGLVSNHCDEANTTVKGVLFFFFFFFFWWGGAVKEAS